MPTRTITPTRMELTRLKARLRTAVRGHKLLKDKRDGLMKRFLDEVRQARALRERVEADILRAHDAFTVASALMSPEAVEQALLYPKQSVSLELDVQNVMSVEVPRYTVSSRAQGDLYPYGFADTSGELDDAVDALAASFRELLELAQREKTCQLLADEIERTRRRVNALEYVKIPEMQEAIRYISMKLEENERGNITRLMKVKELLLEEELRARRERDVNELAAFVRPEVSPSP